MRHRAARLATTLVVSLALVACGREAPTTPNFPLLQWIDVSPRSVDMLIGDTVRLTAKGLSKDGSDVPVDPTWESSEPSLASVDAEGLVTGLAAGALSVSAVEGAVSGWAGVRVLDPAAVEELQILVALPVGEQGTAYQASLRAVGGSEPYTWSKQGGELPPGLALSEQGVISGTPGGWGTFTFKAQVRDAAGATAEEEIDLEIAGVPVHITTTVLPPATVGAPYRAPLEAEGGDGSGYLWFSVIDLGLPPPGITLHGASATVAGTPTEAGDFTFGVEVHSGGALDRRPIQLSVLPATVHLETRVLPGGHAGDAYAATLVASGAKAGEVYSFSVFDGALPPGLELNESTGAIEGTLAGSAAGVYVFRVLVRAGDVTAARVLALAVSSHAASAYNLTVALTGSTLPTERLRRVLSGAVDRWESVITGDLSDVSFSATEFGAEDCEGFGPALNGVSVDDMVLVLNVLPADDEVSGIAEGGPCAVRPGRGLPSLGVVTLDADDIGQLSELQLQALLVHETAHALGFGTLWSSGGRTLLSGRGGDAPRFNGPLAVAAYQSLGGTEAGVPVEAEGGVGTRDAHWAEAVFDTELMTPYPEGSAVAQPLSVITAAAMGDLGYQVDLGAADDFVLPAATAVARRR